MDWHQVKAQVFFQPDAPVGLLSIFELPGVDQIKLAPWITPTNTAAKGYDKTPCEEKINPALQNDKKYFRLVKHFFCLQLYDTTGAAI